MAHERLRPQFLFDEEKIKQLRQIAPECFEDGKINFETLRQNLGNLAQDEEDKDLEHFGLFWPGKRDARKIASMPPQGTLGPIYGEGLKADGTPDTDGFNDSKNVFIEGENLEVLKILQKSYAGKIKMIYIDPPYNTGNDFIYDDDFTEPLQEYLRRTGQVDEEGRPLTTNKRTDGRFHSKWLSMMYPRLRLARNLLTEDGVIFISIDDNEVHNLRSISNEIFGEENFVECLVWKRRATPPNDRIIGRNHEYILVYSKDINSLNLFLQPREGSSLERYKNPDNDPRGPWVPSDLSANGKGGRLTESCIFDIQNPKTGEVFSPPKNKCWLYNKEKVDQLLKENRIAFREKSGTPFLKRFLNEVRDGSTLPTILTNHGVSQDSAKELKELFEKDVFEFPKPLKLIKTLIKTGAENDSMILDFFSGSGTLAQAVYEVNSEENKQINFICVQLQEPVKESSETFKFGFKNLAQVTKERIRRSQQKIGEREFDNGVKIFSLQKSNFKVWSNHNSISVSELENSLEIFNREPLNSGWTNSKLLTEVLLIEGFTLACTLDNLSSYKLNVVVRVSDNHCDHSLIVCLDQEIKQETIKSLELTGSDVFICLDNAISNVDKLRLSDKGLIKTI